MSSDEKMGDPEAASPISSRPPAAANNNNNNFEELMRVTEAAGGGGGGSSSAGNRWPRQETLALLQIRSEMDAAFRDATLKAPLWDHISRKLGELGYTRSGKKCKEKFENVQKYHKRTKEGRGGRQDGKSYKFFNQLEALHHIPSTTTTTTIMSNIPVSSSVQLLQMNTIINPDPTPTFVPSIVPLPEGPSSYGTGIGITFSSDSSSDDEMEEEMDMESADHNKRKRKRSTSTIHDGGDSNDDMRMMEFFEGLMKEVMQKQEAMQQKFLEAIDKREQDRMIREEAWKRQDIARLARQHDLMAQDRAVSASRDAAIISFLQKITGQSIHFPTHAPPGPIPVPAASQDHQPVNPVNPASYPHQSQNIEIVGAQKQLNTTDDDQIVTPIPEQQILPSLDITPSSRWPKTEVVALIQLRSGLESKYQEAGPKGPLWEEISKAMMRMGYNRSAKRCKEKWENINKYYKKVKESNKQRPEDAKTCPYFHELDELYRKKILGNTSTTTSSGNVVVGSSSGILGSLSEQQDVGIVPPLQSSSLGGEQSHDGTTTTTGVAKQPEDMLKRQHQQCLGSSTIEECNNNIDFSNSDDLDLENDEDNVYEEDENEEETKTAYKIQFQRQNVSSSGSNGTASTSFMAMVK